jgi:hypothetical protein
MPSTVGAFEPWELSKKSNTSSYSQATVTYSVFKLQASSLIPAASSCQVPLTVFCVSSRRVPPLLHLPTPPPSHHVVTASTWVTAPTFSSHHPQATRGPQHMLGSRCTLTCFFVFSQYNRLFHSRDFFCLLACLLVSAHSLVYNRRCAVE